MRYQFRVCVNQACRFRYPAQVESGLGSACPRCGAATELAAEIATIPENNHEPIPVRPPPVAALLDNLRSAWNVGSILRTADGVGIHRVYLCGTTPPADHPRVVRTSLGAEAHLDWTWHPNALDLAGVLLAEGAQFWALETTPNAEPLSRASQFDPSTATVLVVGNEVTGIDPGILSLCSRIFWIPMAGIKRSLNTAVAFGIAAYTLAALQGPLTNAE